MKKILLLFLFGSLGLSAQFDPLSQYLNTAFIPNFAPYDSITYSSDTGSLFTPMITAHQHYFTNGKIDTLVVKQFNVDVLLYDGKLSGNRTEIIGIDLTGSTADTIDKTVFVLDQHGRDSLVESHFYSNGFQMNFQARSQYAADSSLQRMDIFAPIGGSMMKVGEWEFYYQQKLMDSIFYTVSPTGNNPGFYKYYYDAAPGKITSMEVYEDRNGIGEYDLMQLFNFGHNAADQVNRIVQYNRNSSTSNMDLLGELRYDVHSQSTIGLPDVLNLQLEIYPNPTSDYLQVKATENFTGYAITDMSGKLVKSGKAEERIDVSQLKSGHYFISLSSEKGSVGSLFLKN